MTPSQSAANGVNCDASLETLYSLIRKRVKCSFIVRRLADVDDVTGDIFLQLAERKLPPFESEEFKKILTKTANKYVRQIKRSIREMLDVDELGESEHPFCEEKCFSDEEEFELVFSEFCESFPEPKRTVFRKSRILSWRNIAELTGLSQRDIARAIRLMPKQFKTFFENYSNCDSH